MECEGSGVSILLTDDPEIREINRQWLGRDRPTDVISFGQPEEGPFPPDFLGDIVISIDTAKKNADKLGLSLDQEIARLLAHGMLHLLGYEHVRGGRQARRMKEMEDRLVAEVEAGQ